MVKQRKISLSGFCVADILAYPQSRCVAIEFEDGYGEFVSLTFTRNELLELKKAVHAAYKEIDT